jgi:hypothetical protein
MYSLPATNSQELTGTNLVPTSAGPDAANITDGILNNSNKSNAISGSSLAPQNDIGYPAV